MSSTKTAFLYFSTHCCFKPKLTCFLSPQGKEFETRLKEKKPGDLSDELRIALGMPVGPVRSTHIIILCQFTEQKNDKLQR